jgi:hypothetical protein
MKQRGVIKPIMNPKKAEAPVPVLQASLPLPPYQLSNISRNYLEDQIEKRNITLDDLNFVYDLGRRIGRYLCHERPTYQDMVAATEMKNLEGVKAVAEGTKEIWIFLPEYGPSKMQPQQYRASIWKTVAVAMLEELDGH